MPLSMAPEGKENVICKIGGKEETRLFLERRGIGLIQGIKVKKPVGEISSEALKEGLLIISAKGNVLRLVPPLVIEKEHVDDMLEILKKVL